MITTTWLAPSADLLGLGGADVRTSGSTMSGAAAPFQGTGLPAVACRRTAPVTAATGTNALVTGRRRVHEPLVERFLAPTYLPTNDGTTLGIHSPGRPQS
ncbi:hypothetical protein GCU60_05970 [Blastococcus saxobsidens]|uniref:Uncharacterized protein n=1 Tax=Blastococcus saxobsidens TaxID=138336 RepID=A0A6L9W0R3_9ACTN|nr:hypothetical protein [Blastococcus saxobsidens]NEK85309.1 hypothetical protein [Blastococcus saxobsidens]